MLAPHASQKLNLRSALGERGWEVLDVAEGDVWNVEELWHIRSNREAWGFELGLQFVVHDYPSWEVAWIEAHGWPVGTESRSLVTPLSFRRHFDEELPLFLDALDHVRREHQTGQRDRT